MLCFPVRGHITQLYCDHVEERGEELFQFYAAVIWKASPRSGAATLMCCSGTYVLHSVAPMLCLAEESMSFMTSPLALLLFRTTNL